MSPWVGLDGLLRAALDTLRAELQPALPAEQRYPAALVANALGIAARVMAEGDTIRSGERAAIAALYPALADATLPQLERRLARELRQGDASDEREERIRAVLVARALARLALTNPDYPKSFRR